MQTSSLKSSRSLAIHLRNRPRQVSHAEWHRHSTLTKKARRILSGVAKRCLSQAERFAQVGNALGWKVGTGGASASSTRWRVPVYKST